MSSSTHSGHEHVYASDRADAVCIWCNAPRPAPIDPAWLISASPANQAEWRTSRRAGFLTGRDPGDED